MVGSGRVPGMEAGRGCRCLFLCSSEEREPGTGLERQTNGSTCDGKHVYIFSTVTMMHTSVNVGDFVFFFTVTRLPIFSCSVILRS